MWKKKSQQGMLHRSIQGAVKQYRLKKCRAHGEECNKLKGSWGDVNTSRVCATYSKKKPLGPWAAHGRSMGKTAVDEWTARWKQNEHLELLGRTQMHKSALYHWQDLLKRTKQQSRAIFIINKLLQE